MKSAKEIKLKLKQIETLVNEVKLLVSTKPLISSKNNKKQILEERFRKDLMLISKTKRINI